MSSPALAGASHDSRRTAFHATGIRDHLRIWNGTRRRSVLIIGTSKAARHLAAYFQQNPSGGCSVRGFLDDGPMGTDVVGRIEDLCRIALAGFVDEVILPGRCEPELVERVIAEARRIGLTVKVVPDLFGLDPRILTFERLGDLPVLSLVGLPASRGKAIVKRTMDVMISALALLTGLPLFALIAILISATSRGPVLYSGWRVGQKGRHFLYHKLRTMVAGADAARASLRARNERHGPIFKIANDPRITRFGRWLRRYSLDELPQFWNVLRGEMSLVGPRPHPLDDFDRYDAEHLCRLAVKPGVTGLWQVTARNDPSFQRSMSLDMEYIEHWSLWLDLRILCRTLIAVIHGSGT